MSRRNYATAFKRYSRTAIPLTAVIGAAAYLTDSKISKRAEQNAAAAFRIINLLGTVSIILTDYGCSLYFRQRSKLSELELYDRKLKDLQSELERLTLAYLKDTNGSSSARLRTLIRECRIQLDDVTAKIAACSADTFLEEIHERNAVRLLQMCRKNKGVYIKLGQHLSMLDHIVPDPYRRHLSNLLANNPVTPWKAVEQIILEDFGEKAKTFFSKIEPDPLASASLAQVHVAYGTDGKKYAVKVQHDGLLECSQGDMVTITFLVDLIPYLFKGFNYKWLTTEMNKNLPLELNFENEKSNLEKCRTYLKDMIAKGVVALPEVKHELCSKRILTMSFEEGVYVSDRSKLLELGLNPQTISRLISEIFCEQIFIHGFVHCG